MKVVPMDPGGFAQSVCAAHKEPRERTTSAQTAKIKFQMLRREKRRLRKVWPEGEPMLKWGAGRVRVLCMIRRRQRAARGEAP